MGRKSNKQKAAEAAASNGAYEANGGAAVLEQPEASDPVEETPRARRPKAQDLPGVEGEGVSLPKFKDIDKLADKFVELRGPEGRLGRANHRRPGKPLGEDAGTWVADLHGWRSNGDHQGRETQNQGQDGIGGKPRGRGLIVTAVSDIVAGVRSNGEALRYYVASRSRQREHLVDLGENEGRGQCACEAWKFNGNCYHVGRAQRYLAVEVAQKFIKQERQRV